MSLRDASSGENHICRPARREDIRATMPLWGRDEVLYDAEVWSGLPRLLEDLMDRGLVRFAVVESVPSRVPRLLGGISFVHPEYIEAARAGGSTLPNTVLRAAMRNRAPFLSSREVGVANARGELHYLALFGNMTGIDLADPAATDFYRTSNEGHWFFHFGYSFHDMWMEVWPPEHVRELRQIGFEVDRQLPLAGGRTANLMKVTREVARSNPYSRIAGLFFPPKPRFRFSTGEQRLLEYALLQASDEEAALELRVSEDAIKKRWRSIYTKVENASAGLLDPADSGTARRRRLLQYLRKHLEELRPYSYS